MTFSRRGGGPRDLDDLRVGDASGHDPADIARRARLAVALQVERGLTHREAHEILGMLGLLGGRHE